jgi:hypothetical protein
MCLQKHLGVFQLSEDLLFHIEIKMKALNPQQRIDDAKDILK